jgi:hypothetical protein
MEGRDEPVPCNVASPEQMPLIGDADVHALA